MTRPLSSTPHALPVLLAGGPPLRLSRRTMLEAVLAGGGVLLATGFSPAWAAPFRTVRALPPSAVHTPPHVDWRLCVAAELPSAGLLHALHAVLGQTDITEAPPACVVVRAPEDLRASAAWVLAQPQRQIIAVLNPADGILLQQYVGRGTAHWQVAQHHRPHPATTPAQRRRWLDALGADLGQVAQAAYGPDRGPVMAASSAVEAAGCGPQQALMSCVIAH